MTRRFTLFALALLTSIPLFAQTTDISGTWTGTVTLSSSRSGCPAFSVSGNGSLNVTQTGANVSGTFNSDVSEQNLFGGCSANGGPVTISFTGTISGNTVTVNASGITGTVTVTGNTLAGSLSGFGDTITVAMTKQGSASSGACNLGMTLNCNGANCSATTINNGSNVCSGQYIVGFVIDDPQNRGTVTNFATTLPLSSQECFDNGSIAFGLGLGACVGDASLNPGGSFTMNGTVNFAGADPSSLLAVTLVLDPTSGETIAESYVINGAPPAATCTPVASVPSVTQSGNSYTVSWTAVTEPNATYTVEESTSSDFSTITNTKQTNSLSQTFTNSPGTTTRYFYRVRANVCSGAPGTNSLPVSIAVQAIPTATVTTRQIDAPTPLGSTAPVKINVQIAGQSQPVSFTATVDKPFLSVSPSSGTLPTSGITLTVTATPSGLPPGASTGTLTVVTGGSGKGGPGANDNTTTTKSVSVSLVTPVQPSTTGLPPANALIIPAVAHLQGFTAPFQSDVRLSNAAASAISYALKFTPSGSNPAIKSTTISVDPGQTIALNDVLRDFFGVGATDTSGDQAGGVLEIRPLNTSSSLNYASSRLFSFNAKGTFGQFIAAIPFTRFATKATLVPLPGQQPSTATPTLSLQQVAQSPSFHTNLGLVEGSGSPASGNIKVYSPQGQLLATQPYSLNPGEQKQFNNFLATVGQSNVDDARIEVTVESATGAVTAYASVLDNNTSDPLEVTPVQVSQVSSTTYTLPGMATLGTTGVGTFHSDVRVYNGGTTSVTVTPTYYPNGGGAPVPAAPFSVGAGQVQAFNDVVSSLFKQSNSGGSIVFTTSSASSLVATGRTYTIDPTSNNGTFGQFIPGVTPSQGIASGDNALQILQLEQSANFRSNIAVFELTGKPATVHVTGYLPDSKTTASTDIPLAANQFVQFSLASMFPGQNVYNARVSVAVTGGNGKVSAYGSVIDNASADPTYVPAQGAQ